MGLTRTIVLIFLIFFVLSLLNACGNSDSKKGAYDFSVKVAKEQYTKEGAQIGKFDSFSKAEVDVANRNGINYYKVRFNVKLKNGESRHIYVQDARLEKGEWKYDGMGW